MFSSPSSKEDFLIRNSLLQSSLRPEKLPFRIEQEYPIVLSEENPQFSHCIHEQGQIVAHANLWPRVLIDKDGNTVASIGLIGNVATHESHRGRGLMKKLLGYLESKAILADMQALILWSDLSKFYQNLGFQSLSLEWHHHFSKQGKSHTGNFNYCEPADHSIQLMKKLLPLREPTNYTLQRDISEFSRLVQIPNTHLVTQTNNGNVTGYFVVGKGFDMQGVIHEWGMPDLDSLMNSIHFSFSQFGYEEVILLSPSSLRKKWRKTLDRESNAAEQVPMALVKVLSTQSNVKKSLERTFIWGLDSI